MIEYEINFFKSYLTLCVYLYHIYALYIYTHTHTYICVYIYIRISQKENIFPKIKKAIKKEKKTIAQKERG